MLDIKNMVINKELNYDPTANTTRFHKHKYLRHCYIWAWTIFFLKHPLASINKTKNLEYFALFAMYNSS